MNETEKSGEVAVRHDENASAEQRLADWAAHAHSGETGQSEYAAAEADGTLAALREESGSDTGKALTRAEAGNVQERIDRITALAHTGNEADLEEYKRLQPVLKDLVARKSGKLRAVTPAGKTGGRITKSDLARLDGMDVPDDPDDYGVDIGDHLDGATELDSRLWEAALRQFHEQGFSRDVVEKVALVVVDVEQTAQELRDENDRRVTARAKAMLRKRFGDDHDGVVNELNAVVRELLPGGASKRLCRLKLADGSTLGSNEDFLNMIINLRDREAA